MEMFDLFGSFVNKICTLISFLTTFSHVLHYGPLEGSKDGKAEVLNFLDDLPDYSWQEPNPDDPLSLVDKVEVSLTYKCEDSLSRRDLLQYVHRNRNNNARRIDTMAKNMDKRIAEQEKNIAEILKNLQLIQSVVTAHHPRLVCSGPFGFSAGGGAFSDEDIGGGRNITAIKIRVGKQRNMVSIQVSSGERVSVHLDWSLL